MVKSEENERTTIGISRARRVRHDATFARAGFSLADGVNTFTAVAQDADGRSATDQRSVDLPAPVDLRGCVKRRRVRTPGLQLERGPCGRPGVLTGRVNGRAYDDENQLIRITEPGKWKSEFVYDDKPRVDIPHSTLRIPHSPCRFSSKEHHAASGLYYYGYRL